MLQSYQDLFSYLPSAEPSDGLFDKITARLKAERQLLVLKRRLAVYFFAQGGSAAVFIFVIKMAMINLNESGFIKFFALIFSDAQIVLTYWQNFLMSLLETLPVLSLLALLVTALIFLELLKLLAKNLKIFFTFKN